MALPPCTCEITADALVSTPFWSNWKVSEKGLDVEL
jgi:hypothetical protein